MKITQLWVEGEDERVEDSLEMEEDGRTVLRLFPAIIAYLLHLLVPVSLLSFANNGGARLEWKREERWLNRIERLPKLLKPVQFDSLSGFGGWFC
uniref:Transmembrane protein n=1 Tax=Oryza sativa subsp. japonica TaxID=39947 RepID=Q69XV7_ORYSJ|nr:hypothetical protein [Oryza sativa Japonica Group]